jgi:hypothetical protein
MVIVTEYASCKHDTNITTIIIIKQYFLWKRNTADLYYLIWKVKIKGKGHPKIGCESPQGK